MMKTTVKILILFIILSSGSLSAQINEPNVRAEEIRTGINSYIGQGLYDSAAFETEALMEYAKKNDLTFYQGLANFVFGMLHSGDSALYYYQNADTLFSIANDTLLRGKTYARMAMIMSDREMTEAAINYYEIASELLYAGGDTLWYGIVNDHLGYIYHDRGVYFKALQHAQKAEWAFGEIGALENLGNLYNSIALIYRKTKNEQEEEQSYIKAIEILEQTGESLPLAMAYNNLSHLYLKKGEIEKGFEFLDEAKQIFKNLDYPLGLSAYYSVLSVFYTDADPPDYSKVIEYAALGAGIARQQKSYMQYADLLYYLGNAYLQTNQLPKAETTLKTAYDVASANDLIFELSKISKGLYNVYKEKGISDKALKYLEQHISLNDSISNEEKIKEFTNLDLTFQFRQQKYQDSLSQVQKVNEMNFAFKHREQKQKNNQLILAFILVVAILLLIAIYIYSKKRKAQNIELDSKNKIISKALQEKEILLKEIHHRVKNNLQTLSSLLQLQSEKDLEKHDKAFYEEGQNRIQAMALVHHKLYQNDNLSFVEIQEYTEELLQQIMSLFSLSDITSKINAAHIQLDIDTAIPLGLILNELITNSCKYAFSGKKDGEIFISIEKNGNDGYTLIHQDSGPGLPDNFDFNKVKSLGLQLVQGLSHQLHGTVNYSKNGGCRFVITFKDNEQRMETE